MPYACDSNDGQPVIVIVQSLQGDAESLAWCADCWPVFIAQSYAALFPEDEPIPLTPTEPGEAADSDDDAAADDTQPGPVQAPPEPAPGDSEGEPEDAQQPPVAVT